jgi:hypothetical protein
MGDRIHPTSRSSDEHHWPALPPSTTMARHEPPTGQRVALGGRANRANGSRVTGVQRHRARRRPPPRLDAVHAAGGRIVLQILHAGRYAKAVTVAPETASPSVQFQVGRPHQSANDITRTANPIFIPHERPPRGHPKFQGIAMAASTISVSSPNQVRFGRPTGRVRRLRSGFGPPARHVKATST